jgi:Winged helix DNA-binding domain
VTRTLRGVALTWPGALAWRLGRQLLDPLAPASVAEVVARLGAVPAWPDRAAELTVGMRRLAARPGDVARAMDAGQLVKVYAFRGATHYLTPQDAGDYLALRASSRMWELPSWVSHYGLTPADWSGFRGYVREVLADGPVTRSELAAALGRSRRYRHLRGHVTDGSDTLLKPLAWQGDMGLGSGRDGEATFLRLDAVPGWSGLPELDAAGPRVVAAYFRTYGPARPERVLDWLGKGLGVKRTAITRWVDGLGDQLVAVTVDDERALILAEHVEAAARPSTEIRLLPGRDPWVMGPGTHDPRVVPPALRGAVSRAANLVLLGGAVAGTWTVRDDRVAVTWSQSAGPVPRAALADEAGRLARVLDRPLEVALDLR